MIESTESHRVMAGVSISEIENRVCQAYAVQISQLHKSIQGQKNEPRLVAMYLGRKIGGMTYPAIAAHYNLGHYKSVASVIIRVQEDERLLRKAEQFRRKWDHTI